MNNDVNDELLRNLSIELTNENIDLKDVILRQEEKIKSLEEDIDFKNEYIQRIDENYRELANEFNAMSKAYEEKVQELDEYVEQYKNLIKEIQLKKAKTNRIVNDLEKALLKQSKKLNM